MARSRGSAWRRISFYWNAAVPHRHWVVKVRDRVGGRVVVAPAGVGTVLVYDVEVHGEESTVLSEPHLQSPLEACAGRPHAIFFEASDAQHDRPTGLAA